MYEFIKNMWIMRRYEIKNVNNCVKKGYITKEESILILNMPQITL